MTLFKYIISLSIFIFISCSNGDKAVQQKEKQMSVAAKKNIVVQPIKSLIHKEGKTLKERILLPNGFERLPYKKGTYGHYLRTVPLKKHGSKVRYFEGSYKSPGKIYCAVVDWTLGKKDLQQCADAAMRLRAEYLYDKGLYKQIRFNFLKDGKPRYYKKFAKKYNRKSFDEYLDYVFLYANTRSLNKQLKKAKWDSLESGDVLIQVGKPFGHAVTVMDTAINKKTKEKIYLLSQSYMPAQDIQILNNPTDKKLSPWYSTIVKDKKGRIKTPEWTFKQGDLRRFR